MRGNEWCHTDLSRDVMCPLEIPPDIEPRERMLMVLPWYDNQARYVYRDVTGDGRPEPFCNFKVRDILQKFGKKIPRGLVGEVVIPWLTSKAGQDEGWIPETFEAARRLAEVGTIVVATSYGTNGGHGHIVLCRPTLPPDAPTPGRIFVAQAGRVVTNYIDIVKAFGHSRFTFFANP